MAVTMKRTAELLPLVLPYAPQCPDFIAEQMIRMAAIEFAERSRAWRHLAEVGITATGTGITVLSGTLQDEEFGLIFTAGGETWTATASLGDQVEPELPAPSPAVVHEIEFAEFNGRKLTAIQFSTIEGIKPGRAEYITQVTPSLITVLPFETGLLRLSMFLKPSSGNQFGTDPSNPLFDRFNVVPDFFITLHGQTLVLGALSRILAVPGETWTDAQTAMLYKAEFEAKLNASFRTNMRGQQRAPQRTRYREF